MLYPTLLYLIQVDQTVANSREAFLGASQELHSGGFHTASQQGEGPRDFWQTKKTVNENNLTACQKFQWSSQNPRREVNWQSAQLRERM